MTGCRISKVKDKKTGRELHILPTNKSYIQNDETDLLERVLSSARAGVTTGIMIGFVCKDGSTGYGVSSGCFDNVAMSLGCAQHLVYLTNETLFEGKKGRDWT